MNCEISANNLFHNDSLVNFESVKNTTPRVKEKEVKKPKSKFKPFFQLEK